MTSQDHPKLKNIETGELYNVCKSPFTIGRGLDCDFVIVNRVVSRSHCSLVETEKGWVLTDLSTNGTMVNDDLLKSISSGILNNDDEISLGSSAYTYKFLLPPKVAINSQVQKVLNELVSVSSPKSVSSFDENGVSDELLNNVADNMLSHVENVPSNEVSDLEMDNISQAATEAPQEDNNVEDYRAISDMAPENAYLTSEVSQAEYRCDQIMDPVAAILQHSQSNSSTLYQENQIPNSISVNNNQVKRSNDHSMEYLKGLHIALPIPDLHSLCTTVTDQTDRELKSVISVADNKPFPVTENFVWSDHGSEQSSLHPDQNINSNNFIPVTNSFNANQNVDSNNFAPVTNSFHTNQNIKSTNVTPVTNSFHANQKVNSNNFIPVTNSCHPDLQYLPTSSIYTNTTYGNDPSYTNNSTSTTNSCLANAQSTLIYTTNNSLHENDPSGHIYGVPNNCTTTTSNSSIFQNTLPYSTWETNHPRECFATSYNSSHGQNGLSYVISNNLGAPGALLDRPRQFTMLPNSSNGQSNVSYATSNSHQDSPSNFITSANSSYANPDNTTTSSRGNFVQQNVSNGFNNCTASTNTSSNSNDGTIIAHKIKFKVETNAKHLDIRLINRSPDNTASSSRRVNTTASGATPMSNKSTLPLQQPGPSTSTIVTSPSNVHKRLKVTFNTSSANIAANSNRRPPPLRRRSPIRETRLMTRVNDNIETLVALIPYRNMQQPIRPPHQLQENQPHSIYTETKSNNLEVIDLTNTQDVPKAKNAIVTTSNDIQEVFDSQMLPVASNVVVADSSSATVPECSSSKAACGDDAVPSTSKVPDDVKPVRAENARIDQNYYEEMENELMCTICATLFIHAVTLGCSHSFCEYCINLWKKKKSDCPICRKKIASSTRTLVLDNIIEKMMESAPEEDKKLRSETMSERKKVKETENATKNTTNRPTRSNTRRARRAHPAIRSVLGRFPSPVRTYPMIEVDDLSDTDSGSSLSGSDDEEYGYNGEPGVYYGGYGRCYSCGGRGHWANGCPFR